MDRKLKHLDFIQGAINRLSTNSFLLKGWNIVLVSALFVIAGSKSDQEFTFLALFPALIIWGLDGYFLWQERMYRLLYDAVRIKDENDVDFSMSTKKMSTGFAGFCATLFSKTLLVFHGAIVGAIFIFYLLAR